MFGYVVVNKNELKFKEFDEYRGFYCGLCRALKSRHGLSGQITLNYDLNFLAVLLTGLYEVETDKQKRRCVMHPFSSQLQFSNSYVDYCADMNVILAYYKCQDDWLDEKSVLKHTEELLLRKSMAELTLRYPQKCQLIAEKLALISTYEKNKETDIDLVSNAFGHVMGEVFAVHHDEWHDALYQLGFYLGKFIYLMDAYEDIEKDIKTGNYNLFKDQVLDDAFEDKIQMILEMMMAECISAFDKLPILDTCDILKNILYSGVWTRYEVVKKKRRGK